jgi:dTDP-4-amino-4,6-dideoxygalactose transaminase
VLNARRYEASFAARGVPDMGVVLPHIHDGHSVHQYVVRVGGGRRDRVMADMKARGVSTMVY